MEEENKPVVKLEESQVATPAAPQPPAMPFTWASKNPHALTNVQQAVALHKTKHGMYAGVPIICQGAKCPYKKTCWIPDNQLDVGGRCPIEIGAIIERFEKYEKEWNVAEDDTTDHGIIRDIIDVEIMMLRADNHLAISGDFIEEIIVGTDDQGKALSQPQLHKAFEAKQRLRAERLKLFEKMNATRKDKKMDGAGIGDPSSRAAVLMEKMRRLQQEGKLIDVTPVAEKGDENGGNEVNQGQPGVHLQGDGETCGEPGR